MNWVPLIVNLATGAIGGNLAGSIFKNLSLGTFWNSFVGILGGGMGATICGTFGLGGEGDGATAIGNLIASIASGTVGGGLLMAVVGFVKKATSQEA